MADVNNNRTHKIVFVGTFPPTDEGIATFNEDLVTAVQKMLGRNALCQVAAINLMDTSPYYFDPRVAWEIDQETREMYINIAKELNKDDDVRCVVIQHEYGIYGGEWGEYIIDFLHELTKPVVTVMHSVLETHPYNTVKFRDVTDGVVSNSSMIVVLSKRSMETLTNLYPEAMSKVRFIPHGIHPVNFISPSVAKKDFRLTNNTVLTTFGLLSRDKGIEYVIKALPKVVKRHPNVLYQVLGQTHPIVRRKEGEKYRTELVQMVKQLGLRKHVLLVDKYLALDELLKYLQATDLYIATSVNKDQAVSGTFSYAIGTGRAVVSTSFIQSREMVRKNMGRLVPARDSKAYAIAINDMLADRKALSKSHRVAFVKTRSMLWTNVAKAYINAIDELVEGKEGALSLPDIDLSYLKKMTKRSGILQFAKYDIPSEKFGYTLDDNARALIAINWLIQQGFEDKGLTRLHRIYFRFILASQSENGEFVNYFDKEYKKTRQNEDENPQEHYGRAMWALAETILATKLSAKTRNSARRAWKRSLGYAEELAHPRPKALLLTAACKLHKSGNNSELHDLIVSLADSLVTSYYENKEGQWQWFEKLVSYHNAVLPQSLALAFRVTGNKEYLQIARKTFAFLINNTFMGDVYVPIGQENWYKKGRARSYYDQQPEDPAAMVLGLVTMYEVTKQQKYAYFAKQAFTWFIGNNLNGIPLYNSKTGGVYDGLQREGVNKNQGAEALVSYLLARIRLEDVL